MARPLFLYGTLLDPALLAAKAGRRPRGLVSARAPGFRRVTFRATPYPTLVPGADSVAGVVFRPTVCALRRLAAYEGPGYRLRPLRVVTARGPVWARAWMVARHLADATRPWPR